ncbi:MAG: 50S ribosomal protein L25 [Planctomycetota bacterium]|jgi:large subunit ribosomal protein L25
MQEKTPTITALPRKRIGSHYAQRLRREGRLPAVIYGHQRAPLPVSVDEKTVLTHLRHGTHVLKVDVEGARTETCLVKDLQFGYLGDNVIHVDFARVGLHEEVDVHVQLNFVGAPAAAQRAGAILGHDLTDLAVVCRVDEIPDEIKVDLAAMGDGTMLLVGDLTLPPGVRAGVDPDTPVAHVSFVRHVEVVGEEAEVAPAPTEPEVITEAKAEEKEKEKEPEASP